MPLYEFECTNRDCQKRFDVVVKIAWRNVPRECPVCEGPAERVVSAPMIAGSFEPYRTVAHDKETKATMVIRTREEHAAVLRRHGYEEVGNDKSMALPGADERAARRREQLLDAGNSIVFDLDLDTKEAKL